jgi:hypothetical protein
MLYHFAFFFLTIILFPKEKLPLNMEFFLYFTISLFFTLIISLYYVFLHNEKYKYLIDKYERNITSKTLSILFPLIAFLLLNFGWITKMLQNQGKF